MEEDLETNRLFPQRALALANMTAEDYRTNYWPQLQTAVDKLLEGPPPQTQSGPPIEFEPMYSAVYKCVCQQHSEALYSDLTSHILKHFLKVAEQLQSENGDELIDKYYFVVHRAMYSLDGIIPIFTYLLGIRVDGRGRLDYRHLEIETGLVSTANGSARVRLDRTDVLITVKMEMEQPPLDQPNEGQLRFFVNCSANAAPEFEGRGGEDLATTLSAMLDRLYSSPYTLDRSCLCVVPGKHVRVLYVDIEILDCAGNLFDSVSIGVKAALWATQMPRIIVTGEDGGELEFGVSDNPHDVERINVSNAPILITHLRITEDLTVVDPTPEEEWCGPVQVVVGVTPQGLITALQQLGQGTFTPYTLSAAIKLTKELGMKIHTRLTAKLMQEEQILNRAIRGFL